MIAFLDIETASRPEWLAVQAVKAGVPLGGLVGCQPWVLEHAADGALSPWTGRVVCWALADDEGELRSEVSDAEHGSEASLLHGLLGRLQMLEPDTIVAHGGHDFDFPFLRCRSLALGLPELAALVWQDKPWGNRMVDTADPSWAPRPRQARKGWEYSLDALAGLLGIERVPTIPGAEVPAAWYAGRTDEIRAHCEDDVRTLRLVHQRLAAGRR